MAALVPPSASSRTPADSAGQSAVVTETPPGCRERLRLSGQRGSHGHAIVWIADLDCLWEGSFKHSCFGMQATDLCAPQVTGEERNSEVPPVSAKIGNDGRMNLEGQDCPECLVEQMGIKPTTSSLRTKRSIN